MYTWFRLPMDPAAIHPSFVQSTLNITSSFPRGKDSASPDSRSYIPMLPSSAHPLPSATLPDPLMIRTFSCVQNRALHRYLETWWDPYVTNQAFTHLERLFDHAVFQTPDAQSVANDREEDVAVVR